MSIGPFLDAGFTAVDVTDIDGNVLARGGLTVLDQWGRMPPAPSP